MLGKRRQKSVFIQVLGLYYVRNWIIIYQVFVIVTTNYWKLNYLNNLYLNLIDT